MAKREKTERVGTPPVQDHLLGYNTNWEETVDPASRENEAYAAGDLVQTDPSLRGLDISIIPSRGVGIVVDTNPSSGGLIDVMWDDGELYLLHRDWVVKVQ